jgi:3,4-dihydroxy 2-butanone 4-phosphate synthase / GTP cyclohydrolase II
MSDNIDQAIAALRDGHFIIVVDDDEQGGTGDLVLAASAVTGEKLNFMMQQARGLMAVAMTAERLAELDLPPMVSESGQEEGGRAAFAVSVDARAGGDDSAAGRATTVAALLDPATQPRDLLRPGHVLPIRAKPGGSLVRAGHTEAAVDLVRLSGGYPAAVICRVLNAAGQPADLGYLRQFAEDHGLLKVSIAQVIALRRRTEKLVVRQAEAHLPTIYGEFDIVIYSSVLDNSDYVAIIKGEPGQCEAPLVRVHSGCLTGDILGSCKCDCGWQLAAALRKIEEDGCGVVLYVASHEGRGIGLANKIRAYHLQEGGLDTVEANVALGFAPDLRDYGMGAQVLADLGITRMRLMTNNPAKFAAMAGHGLEVIERVSLEGPANEFNERYLSTKRDKMGHLLSGEPEEEV